MPYAAPQCIRPAMSNFSAKRLLLLRERGRDAEKRRAALEDDPDCRDVLPNRICYVWCKFVLRLGTDTTYKLRFWDRHKDTNRHVANGGAAAGRHGSQAVGLRVSKPRRLDGTIPNVVWRHGARPISSFKFERSRYASRISFLHFTGGTHLSS
jgi:hypothetical protein